MDVWMLCSVECYTQWNTWSVKKKEKIIIINNEWAHICKSNIINDYKVTRDPMFFFHAYIGYKVGRLQNFVWNLMPITTVTITKNAINIIIYVTIELRSNIKFTLTKSRRYFFSSVHFCNCFSASACEIPLYSDKIAASVSFTPLAIPFASLMAM